MKIVFSYRYLRFCLAEKNKLKTDIFTLDHFRYMLKLNISF